MTNNTNQTTSKKGFFQKLGAGVKTTFGIKDLTPQQKEEISKRKKEEQAYRQVISERQKQAWQVAYKEELAQQRKLYAEQKEKEARQRGVARARTEMQTMSKPRQAGFFGKISAFGEAMEKQLIAQQHSQKSGANPNVKPMGFQDIVLGTPKKVDSWTAKQLGMAYPSAQAMEHKLVKYHSKREHLKKLGTQEGGVTIAVNGTQITLAPKRTAKKTSGKRVRHLKHKIKFKKSPKQSNQFGEMFWKM